MKAGRHGKVHSESEKPAFCQLLRALNAQSSSMRGKLLLYLCCLIFISSGILLLLLLGMGVFTESGRSLRQTLEVQLRNRSREMQERLAFYTGNGIYFSERLSRTLEQDILSYPYNIRALQNNAVQLEEMQERLYPLLENELNITRVSGVFAVFDATVNTKAPGAATSRSGIYLRLGNVSSSTAPENDIFLFRGHSELAMQKQIQLHNRWNMEFNTGEMEWYSQQLAEKSTRQDYLWIERHRLRDTWENGIFLSIPVVGSGGERYGLCGLEISELLFRLSYAAVESRYGDMVTVFAPLEGDQLLLPGGLIGERGDSYFDDGQPLRIEQGRRFNSYLGEGRHYLGMHQPFMEARDASGRQWALAVLLSYSDYQLQNARQRSRIIAAVAAFVLIMLLCSFVLSHHFVKPILRGLEALKTDAIHRENGGGSTGISELDALAEFLELKNAEYRNGGRTESGLPPEIKELFDRFVENSRTLTLSERNILSYYIRGYQIAEVPALACVSLNTVRKHNRSIYEKLGVRSRDELQLYLDLLKRCGRLSELEQSAERVREL